MSKILRLIAMGVLSGGAPAPSSLLTDLVAYWKLDEASGQRNDSVGSSHLADNNTVASAAGKISNAALFVTANNEYLSIADNAALSVGDIDFTFDMWIKFTSFGGATRRIFGKGIDATANNRYVYTLQHTAGGALQWIVTNHVSNPNVTSVETLNTGTWYYVRVFHDSVNNLIGIQINNNTPTTAADALGSVDDDRVFYLGAGPGATLPVDATIDEFAMWKKMLTTEEIAERYNAGNGNTYPFDSGGSADSTSLYYGTSTFDSSIDT